MQQILILGGGAAGLMAAGTAAEQGAQVTLLETNEKVGRKLFITGKGRCNVCNNCDVQEVLRNVPVNPRFLYSALGGFGPADVMDFFENHGVASRLSAATVCSRSRTSSRHHRCAVPVGEKGGCDHRTYDRRRAAHRGRCAHSVRAGHKTYKADRIIRGDRRRILSADRLDR